MTGPTPDSSLSRQIDDLLDLHGLSGATEIRTGNAVSQVAVGCLARAAFVCNCMQTSGLMGEIERVATWSINTNLYRADAISFHQEFAILALKIARALGRSLATDQANENPQISGITPELLAFAARLNYSSSEKLPELPEDPDAVTSAMKAAYVNAFTAHVHEKIRHT